MCLVSPNVRTRLPRIPVEVPVEQRNFIMINCMMNMCTFTQCGDMTSVNENKCLGMVQNTFGIVLCNIKFFVSLNVYTCVCLPICSLVSPSVRNYGAEMLWACSGVHGGGSYIKNIRNSPGEGVRFYVKETNVDV